MATVSQARLTMAVMGGVSFFGRQHYHSAGCFFSLADVRHKQEGGAFINCHSSMELKKRKINYII